MYMQLPEAMPIDCADQRSAYCCCLSNLHIAFVSALLKIGAKQTSKCDVYGFVLGAKLGAQNQSKSIPRAIQNVTILYRFVHRFLKRFGSNLAPSWPPKPCQHLEAGVYGYLYAADDIRSNQSYTKRQKQNVFYTFCNCGCCIIALIFGLIWFQVDGEVENPPRSISKSYPKGDRKQNGSWDGFWTARGAIVGRCWLQVGGQVDAKLPPKSLKWRPREDVRKCIVL